MVCLEQMFLVKEQVLLKKDPQSRITGENLRYIAYNKQTSLIESIVLHEHFRDSAIYHSGCMTKCLLKTQNDKIKDETVDDLCDHNQTFKALISEISRDLVDNKRHFYFHLLLLETCSGVYIPNGLPNVTSSGYLIQEVSNNININR